jgi:hypothetical protein
VLGSELACSFIPFNQTTIPETDSTDGINWTSRTVPTNDWLSVTYGNGRFVAVASSGSGNRVMTSPDGITWSSCQSAADYDWQSIAYGNGVFVSVCLNDGGANKVMSNP